MNIKKISYSLGFALSCTFSQQVFGSEQSVYDFLWLDPDKKVYVLQNKIHKKEKTNYFNVGIGKTINSDYQTTRSYVLQAGHYFHEEWGVELLYIDYNNKPNTAYQNLQQVNTSYPFIRRLKQSYGAMAVWAPFYGKVNTFNKIIYFDWMFGAGLTQIEAENNRDSFSARAQENIYKSERLNAAALKTKFQVHATKNLHLNLEILNQHYRAPAATNPATKELNTNTDVIISVGFSF